MTTEISSSFSEKYSLEEEPRETTGCGAALAAISFVGAFLACGPGKKKSRASLVQVSSPPLPILVEEGDGSPEPRPSHKNMANVPFASKPITYHDLVCTAQDQANVAEIITIVATTGKVSLLVNTRVKQLGAQVHHLHPLKFLSAIFSGSELKGHMDSIFDDYFKRSGFMGGLAPSLEREAEKGRLDQFAADFAKEVNVSVEPVREYFRKSDWKNLVLFLIRS